MTSSMTSEGDYMQDSRAVHTQQQKRIEGGGRLMMRTGWPHSSTIRCCTPSPARAWLGETGVGASQERRVSVWGDNGVTLTTMRSSLVYFWPKHWPRGRRVSIPSQQPGPPPASRQMRRRGRRKRRATTTSMSRNKKGVVIIKFCLS